MLPDRQNACPRGRRAYYDEDSLLQKLTVLLKGGKDEAGANGAQASPEVRAPNSVAAFSAKTTEGEVGDAAPSSSNPPKAGAYAVTVRVGDARIGLGVR